MNGLDVGSAIVAITTAFHTGADSMREIKKRHTRKRKSEHAALEKLVLDTLEMAKAQVSSRYDVYFQEVGPQFKFGDDAARETLLRIALTMQTELVRSLQIARDHENAILDLMRLHEDAIVYKRNVLNILDDLRQRINQAPAQAYLDFGQFQDRSQKEYSVSGPYVQDLKPDVPVVVVPEPDESPPKSTLGRLLSMRRSLSISRKPSTSSTASRRSLVSPLEWLEPASQKTEDFDVIPLRIEEVDEPSEAPLSEPKNTPPSAPRPVQQQDSNRLSVTNRESNSSLGDYSDKILVSTLNGREESISPNTSSRIRSLSSTVERSSSSATPPTPISTYSSPTSSVLLPDGPTSFRMRRPTRGNSLSTTASSDRASVVINPVYTPPPPATILGRPSKDNNYWGFCKGAWSTREDPRRGFSVAVQPQGMYNRIESWQCRHCTYSGDIFGRKKPYTFDPRIRVAHKNGIQYKWMFLAKSHVKRKRREDGSDCYGCVFCVDEGKGTGIFGEVGTLMGHIWFEHRHMRPEVARKNNCIIGDVQKDDVWDINIPEHRIISEY